jgi:hypothetical protein
MRQRAHKTGHMLRLSQHGFLVVQHDFVCLQMYRRTQIGKVTNRVGAAMEMCADHCCDQFWL